MLELVEDVVLRRRVDDKTGQLLQRSAAVGGGVGSRLHVATHVVDDDISRRQHQMALRRVVCVEHVGQNAIARVEQSSVFDGSRLPVSGANMQSRFVDE